MSYSRAIRFAEAPKGVTVSFVGEPPVPAGESAERVRRAHEQGKAEASAFYQAEIQKLRAEFAHRQAELLASMEQRSASTLAELDRRLPDVVLGLAERVIGQTTLDGEAVAGLVKQLVAEFSGEDEQLEVYLCPADLTLLKGFARKDDPAPAPQEEGEGGFAGAIAGIFDGLEGDDSLLEGYANLTFHEDPSLGPGDCQIKSRFGLLDGRIATKLRKIETELKEG